MNDLSSLPPVLDVAETAAALRVDPKTVRRLLADGELKGAIVGRHWRVVRASVEELLGLGPIAAAPAFPPLPDRVPEGRRPGRPRKVRRRSVVRPEPGV